MSKVSFSELIKGEVPVLVDFYADWCGPCQMMPPILREVKDQLGEDVKILKIDVDKNQALAQQLQIMSIPTIIIFKNGGIAWRTAGVPSPKQLLDAVKEQITN